MRYLVTPYVTDDGKQQWYQVIDSAPEPPHKFLREVARCNRKDDAVLIADMLNARR